MRNEMTIISKAMLVIIFAIWALIIINEPKESNQAIQRITCDLKNKLKPKEK